MRALLSRAVALAAVLFVTAMAGTAHALDDGLARTPPLGWNNWYATFCNIDEELIKQTADAMVASGMRDAGYRYVNLDDCWMDQSRDAQGRLRPDPDRFPSGMKALAHYVHSRGLKIGIYEDVGTKTCAGYPGSLDHEETDARTFAEWGIDFVKVDWCNVPFDRFPGMSQQEVAKELYGRWSRAIRKSGRKMVFSICIWDPSVKAWEFSAPLAHMWRTSNDYGPGWRQIVANADHAETLGDYAGPGAWNDPDILMVGLGDLTTEEYRSHFSLWSMLAAPLLAGNDLRSMTWQVRDILTNREVLAVDQDPLGEPGRKVRVDADTETEVWSRPLEGGDRAVLLFNRSTTAQPIATTAEEVGLPRRERYRVRDLWRHETRESAGRLSAFVPPHGIAMLRVTTDGGPPAPPAATLSLEVEQPDARRPWVAPGEPVDVSATLADDGRAPLTGGRLQLVAPYGWNVQPRETQEIDRVDARASVQVRWTVTPPPDARAGDQVLFVDGSWRSGRSSEQRTVETRVNVRAAPEGDAFLSDLEWIEASSGWQSVRRDREVGGGPLRLDGRTYEKGLGAATPASIVYWLAGGCTRFEATIGIDDVVEQISPSGGTATFEVWLDGERVWTSGVIRRGTATPLSLDVTGAGELELRAGEAGDGGFNDRVDWADARVRCDGAQN